METSFNSVNTQTPAPFRGFLTKLLSEAFYQEEFIPAHITEPENLSIYDYEDPCDRQIFIKNFLGKMI